MVNVVEIENCSDENSCSFDGFNLYNTNLVFDRNGCIISRYRKYNLFVEPLMNITEQPDIAMFHTDFGVTFGHFICFDILFKSPAINLIDANVTHFLYPSMWYSETPFLTSLQVQQGFAATHNVVLLSAGANNPSTSTSGSGIFVGKHGAVKRLISYEKQTKLMIAEVPIDVNDEDYQSPELSPGFSPTEMDGFSVRSSNLGRFYEMSESAEIEYQDVTCKFKVNYTEMEKSEDQEGYNYKFAVYSGERNIANIVVAGQVFCAIVACSDAQDDTTCGVRFKNSENLVSTVKFNSIFIEMEIKDFESENFAIMPTSLDFSLLPLESEKFCFEKNNGGFETELNSEIDNLLTFGMYGRNFNLDEKIQVVKNDENCDDDHEGSAEIEHDIKDDDDDDLTLKMVIYVVLMIVLCIITTIMVRKKLQQPSFEETKAQERKQSRMYSISY